MFYLVHVVPYLLEPLYLRDTKDSVNTYVEPLTCDVSVHPIVVEVKPTLFGILTQLDSSLTIPVQAPHRS